MINRPCSFGQTNNPLENIFLKQEDINTNQYASIHHQQDYQSQDQQLHQKSNTNNEENMLIMNQNTANNSFQQPFNYEWNQALSGNGFGQKNTSLIQDEYIQNIINQIQKNPIDQQKHQTISTINLSNQQPTSENYLSVEKAQNNENNSDFHRLVELDYKRIQTEESSSDSIIYKGEEVDKILSRYSFQMLQENNEGSNKINDNMQQQQYTPGSLSYSINDLKSCSDNIHADQDASINFNLKPPLCSYTQVQSFNDKVYGMHSIPTININPNQSGIKQFNNDNNNNNNGQNQQSQFYNLSHSYQPQNNNNNNNMSNSNNLGVNGQAGNSINVQEYLNLSKSDLFSNNLSGIKWSLLSQGSSAFQNPFSTNTASNLSSNQNQKINLNPPTFIPSSSTNQQNLTQPSQVSTIQSKQSTQNVNNINNNQNLNQNQNNNNNLSQQNLNFQKQEQTIIFEQKDKQLKCQECTLNKQQISFLEIQLKESQEREETQKRMNDSLMNALNAVKDDKQETTSSSQIGKHEYMRIQYEKEIQQLREQMNGRLKQQENASKQLIQKFDELEEVKKSLELEVRDLKKQIEQSNIQINLQSNNLSTKNTQIFQLNEEIKKFQQLNLAFDENKVSNLEKKIELMQKNHQNEVQQIMLDADKESQKQNTIIAKTIESFENKLKMLLGEKSLLEKTNNSTTEINSDLRQKMNDEIQNLRKQKDAALYQIQLQQKTIDQQKVQVTAHSSLLCQIEEQERTIEHLQGISLAHDSLQIQFVQQAANIKHLQLKNKELSQENSELKAKRGDDMKNATSKYAELASKLSEHVISHNKMKKDFQRKSAMIIREILNKDTKIRQLQQKLQIISSNSTSYNNSNNSNLLTGPHIKRDKSPLARLVQEDKTLSDNPNFLEFNKSQLLSSPPINEKTRSTTLTCLKHSQNDVNDKILEELQSRSRSPVNRGTSCTTQQYWQNFMDMSNLSSDNLLNGLQSLPLIIGEEEEENLNNLSSGNQQNNISPDVLKNRYESLLQQRNILEQTINDLKLQLNKKNELEICLKNEVRFVVEYLVQVLADQIVLDIREKENMNIQGGQSLGQSGFQDSTKAAMFINEEERIMRETDKILKQHIIKLQQKSLQYSMIECFNILNSILGQNVGEQKQKQNIPEKQPLQVSESKQKSQNIIKLKLSNQNQNAIDKSIKQDRNGKKLNIENNNSKPSSNFSQSLFVQQQNNQSQKRTTMEHSVSSKQLINRKQPLNKNNSSLNASNTSVNSPTKFKTSALKLSDLKIDQKQLGTKQQSSSPINRQPQYTPTRAQKMQKFGYFLSKQSILNNNNNSNSNASSSKIIIKTEESNSSKTNINHNFN